MDNDIRLAERGEDPEYTWRLRIRAGLVTKEQVTLHGVLGDEAAYKVVPPAETLPCRSNGYCLGHYVDAILASGVPDVEHQCSIILQTCIVETMQARLEQMDWNSPEEIRYWLQWNREEQLLKSLHEGSIKGPSAELAVDLADLLADDPSYSDDMAVKTLLKGKLLQWMNGSEG